MANLSVDVNSWPSFILRWIFAGVWGAVGWVLSTHYLIPHLPF